MLRYREERIIQVVSIYQSKHVYLDLFRHTEWEFGESAVVHLGLDVGSEEKCSSYIYVLPFSPC